MDREATELKRQKDLEKIREKKLKEKSIIVKKRKPTKVKLTGRDAADAKRQEKLEVLKLKSDIKKALSKKNKKSDKSIKTSIRPKARIIKISVDESGIPESKAILKAFNKLKKLLNKK